MTTSKIRFITAAGIVVLLVLTQILYDPISSAKHALTVSNARSQLPEARAKWESLGITDYTFEIQGNGRSICEPSAIIEVKNDIVVKVEIKDFYSNNSPVQLLSPDKWADPNWGNEVFLCNYSHFTMTWTFDLLDSTLRNFPYSIMRADFDQKYGFLTDFSFGIYVGYGLSRPQISDCCNIFSIRNFQPLNNR